MIIAEMGLAELIGVMVSFLLTLLIMSYLLGDNPLFRLAVHLFIGVASGLAAIVALYNVILPHLVLPLLGNDRGQQGLTLIPLILAILLFTKLSPQVAFLGNPSMAYLVGVGAATAIGGAVSGTLFPQVIATVNIFDSETLQIAGENIALQVINGTIILIGSVTSLAYFHYSARWVSNRAMYWPAWIENLAQVGQVFIAVTLGALFAGVYSAALMALIERLAFLADFIQSLVVPFLPS